MTDKSNCSQLQVNCDKITDSWWDLLFTTIFDCPSLLVAALKAEYTLGKAPINIIARQSIQNLKYFQVWIHKVVYHIFIFVLWRFTDWWFGYLLRGEKDKSNRKRKWKIFVDIFYLTWCRNYLDMDFPSKSEYWVSTELCQASSLSKITS